LSLHKSGFSLVELMVVIAILAILSVISLPKYNAYKAKAARITIEYNLAEMAKSYKAFYLSNESPPGTIAQIMDSAPVQIGPYDVNYTQFSNISAIAPSICVNGTEDHIEVDLAKPWNPGTNPSYEADGLSGCL
jgi:prepilin-type N-terminal cleavage/methylation domain-containing protein